MKIYRVLAAVLVCLMITVTFLPVPVSAVGSIDLDEAASLTVTERFNDTGLAGVTFDLYLVSTVDETGELTPVEAFGSYAAALDIRGKDDAAWQALAEELERKLILGEFGEVSPADTAVTDENGAAHFPSGGKSLTLGLYLVPGTQKEHDNHVYSTAPFFVLLPEQNIDSNTWNYHVSAKSKTSEVPLLADIEVIKIWKDDCHKADRPHTISIQLMQDGNAYGEAVTLPHNGEWKYTWKSLDQNHTWTVTEKKADGYKEPEIKKVGNTFVITNTCSKPGTPATPTTPGTPTAPGTPTLPQTGQLWWPVPVLIAMGLLLVIIGIIRRRGVRDDG